MNFQVKSNKMEECIPLLAYEQGMLISRRGDATRLFEVQLPEVFCISDNEFENLHAVWGRALKCLPEYSIAHKQDIFDKGEGIENEEEESERRPIFKRFKNVSDVGATMERGEGGEFLQEASKGHFRGREVLEHRCYLYLTLSTKKGMKTTSAMNAIRRNRIVPAEAIDESRLEKFREGADQFIAVLKAGGIGCRELTPEEVLGTERHFGIIEQYLSLNYSRKGEIMQDLHIEDKDLMIGDKYVSCFSLGELADLPNQICTHQANGKLSTDVSSLSNSFAYPLCLGLPFSHIYNQYFFIESSEEILKELETKGKKMESLSRISRQNAINKVFNDNYLNEAQVRKERCIRCACNVMVWDEIYNRLLQKNSTLGGNLSMMDCNGSKTEVIVPHLFWAGIPGAASEYPSEMKFLTFVGQGCCLINNETNYREIGVNGKGIMLTDRVSGRPLKIDLSDEPFRRGWISAKNKFILGPSGSGKSFFTNVLAAQKYRQGEHIVIVDVGDSYQGLCSLIHEQSQGADGIYYSFKENEPIQFNPFFVEDFVYTEEKMAQLLSLVCILWKNEHESITKAEETQIETAINLYIKMVTDNRKEFACFNSFYNFLAHPFRKKIEEEGVRRENFDIENLLQVLAPYAKGGKYDYLLNSKERIDLLHKRFIVFELDNIKDHKVLFPVVTIVLMDTFLSKMRRLNFDEHKVILIEEAWKAISKAGTAEFVRYLYKTVRKHNGEVAVVTQEVQDIVGNEIIKDTIINNADCKILLDQSKFLNRFSEIQEVLALSEKEKAQILSINRDLNFKGRARYKEVFISWNSVFSAVYGVEVSPEEYWCFTSNKEEKGLLMKEIEKSGSVKKGIEKMTNRV